MSIAGTAIPATPSNFQAIMKGEVANAAEFEQRLATLQSQPPSKDALNANLREAQEIITLYNKRKVLVKEYISNAVQRDNLNVPLIRRATDRTLDVVHDVEWKLPGLMSQLIDVKRVYELGRRRAQTLQAELEWTAKSDYERWRSTLLGKSPLSAQQLRTTIIVLILLAFTPRYTTSSPYVSLPPQSYPVLIHEGVKDDR
ncbi:hypothetical protein Clacol_005559 [Clathrus columnatus]|uniref:Uncharacterized protein n=1 Tax=Clathrus columnatus TaxID=1419009 RepID=A0AAV5A9N5_9AGAM|nr:hypothetical protein Clacol_005559 [Clathrus columnatus]